MKRLVVLLPLLAAADAAPAAPPAIKLNQIGYLPGAEKLAVLPANGPERVDVVGEDGKTVVFTGRVLEARHWASAGESVRVADFSALATPGRYRLRAAGLPLSDSFVVAPDAYGTLGRAAQKAFYYNRSGMALAPRHAGAWARPAGHPDDKVLVHASAASPARPAGTVVKAARGWYDAGDYNKYIPSAAISTWTLLAALEHFPQAFARQDLGIPESGDAVPDLLDEAMWNLDWMLAMQDPADGGVYHKLTNLRFDAMVLPHEAMREPRYVVKKSTAAALGFAATMATASRVVAGYEGRWPGLSKRMLAAAEAAWNWAQANPAAHFSNPPDVVTGEYGDRHLDDELAWAAAELYITTGKASYYTALRPETVSNTVPAWDDVRGLAWVSLAHHRDRLGPDADRALIASRIEALAARLAKASREAGYRVWMAGPDFVWGSNAVMLNGAMMLLQAYRMDGKRDNLAAAQSALDWVLGRNPLGYSFVTGFGARPSLHPHHRPSQGDKVAAPVPGFVTGGPNPLQQDRSECPPYPSSLPALSYLDHVCSYASNEVAINWNAPLVYVTAPLQVLTPSPPETAVEASNHSPDALLREEQELQFAHFTNSDAFEIGTRLVALARQAGKPVTIEIHRNGALLFAHALDGAPPDHREWIRRKANLTNRLGHSSYYVHTEVRARGGDIDAMPGFDPRDYAAHGGAFPIVLKGSGQVGTITVSGLPGREDHELVVRALRAWFKQGS